MSESQKEGRTTIVHPNTSTVGVARKRPMSAAAAATAPIVGRTETNASTTEDAPESDKLFFAQTIPPISVMTDSYEIQPLVASNEGKSVPGVILEKKKVGDRVDVGVSTNSSDKSIEQMRTFLNDNDSHARSVDSKALLEHWEATAYGIGIERKTYTTQYDQWPPVQRPVSGNAANVAKGAKQRQTASSRATVGIDDKKHSVSASDGNVFGSGFKMALKTHATENLYDKLHPFERDVSIPQIGSNIRYTLFRFIVSCVI